MEEIPRSLTLGHSGAARHENTPGEIPARLRGRAEP